MSDLSSLDLCEHENMSNRMRALMAAIADKEKETAMTFEELEKEANGDAGRGLVLALLEIAASIRDASENIALALDGIAEGALQEEAPFERDPGEAGAAMAALMAYKKTVVRSRHQGWQP